MEPIEQTGRKAATSIGPSFRGGFAIRKRMRRIGSGRSGSFIPGTGGGGGPPSGGAGRRGAFGMFFGINGKP